MQEFTIEGFGEHAKFNALRTGNKIELCVVGATETILAVTAPDGTEKTITMRNESIRDGIIKGWLSPVIAEKWYVKREEDKKYYSKNHRWVSSIEKACEIDSSEIDKVIKVLRDRNYKAFKVAV